MDDLDKVARHFGFKDKLEMQTMMSSLSLRDRTIFEEYVTWIVEDGTKTGLQKLIEKANSKKS